MATGKNHLLLIAIGTYADRAWSYLPGPARDVAALKRVLYNRYDFAPADTRELLDEAATASAIRRQFLDVRRLQPDDNLVIYHSGHGYRDEVGNTYWIPHNAGGDRHERNGWFPHAELRQTLVHAPCRHVLLISDSCFSGDLLEVTRDMSRPPGYEERADRLVSREVLTSGDSEPVADAMYAGLSPFLFYLKRALEDTSESWLDAESLHERLRRGVTGQSPQYGYLRQAGHERGGALILRPRVPAPATPAGVPAAAPPATPAAAPPAVDTPRPVLVTSGKRRRLTLGQFMQGAFATFRRLPRARQGVLVMPLVLVVLLLALLLLAQLFVWHEKAATGAQLAVQGGVAAVPPVAASTALSPPPTSTAPPARTSPELVAVPGAEYAPLDGLATGSEAAQAAQREAVNSLHLPLEVRNEKTGIVMRLIPAGTFAMGSPKAEQDALVATTAGKRKGDVELQHQVTLTQAFYCGKFPITQRQWIVVMGSSPAVFARSGIDAPVENVSWEECQQFLTKLCITEGLTSGTYRLLTEAEWEYACRAGTSSALYTGDLDIRGARNAPALDPIAWYGGNSGVAYAGGYDSSGWKEKQYPHRVAGTHPVGQKRLNAFGLGDMLGNVYQCCENECGVLDRWTGLPDRDSLYHMVRVQKGYRVIRGGGWASEAFQCRAAYRSSMVPNEKSIEVGFRV